MSEKQFKKFFTLARKMKGKQGYNFLILLESRLDNMVYRMGLAVTRRQARQLVTHGHITVDGKKNNIPSYIVKPGQTIGVKESSRNLTIIREALESLEHKRPYVTFDESTMTGQYVRYPEREEFLPEIKENLIVEFYNR